MTVTPGMPDFWVPTDWASVTYTFGIVGGHPTWVVSSATGSVDPAQISAILGLLASKASLLSPNFLGTPKKNGVALATTADLTSAGVDPSETAGLRGQVASKAPLLSPQFIGTPRANALPLATQAYADAAVAAVSYDSAQAILASQIFGA